MTKKVLGLFQLVMINVIAVDSIRTLTFSAAYGFALVFFYLLAVFCFFIPTALVSAELGSGWPTTGGIYVWVREAFGKRIGLLTIWFSWLYNVIWYPTMMVLIAGTISYFFNPALIDSPLYMGSMALFLFWAITLINCMGMRASSILSTIGALVGTIFPMLVIMGLGALWWFKGMPMQIAFTWDDFFPKAQGIENLAFLTNVLFGLLGLEMSATHAQEMRNPAKDYPKSVFLSAIVIVSTIILASLAIAFVVPARELSLAAGVMQAFATFFQAYGVEWMIPFFAAFIVIGGLGGVGAWIIGPTKGLLAAGKDGSLPAFFAKTDRRGTPIRILIVQAALVSLLCLGMLLAPTVNSSFWILSAMTAQLALLVYIGLFAAALKLHHHKPHIPRPFRVPGGTLGMRIVCGLGIFSCLTVILFGFLPPSQIAISNVYLYEAILIGGMLILCLSPFILFRKRPI